MSVMRLRPEELREAAAHLRQLGGELSHIHWQLHSAWARLGNDRMLPVSSDIQNEYEQVRKSLSSIDELIYQYAWVLEAMTAWIEEADQQAAMAFLSLLSHWEALTEQQAGNKLSTDSQ